MIEAPPTFLGAAELVDHELETQLLFVSDGWLFRVQ